MDGNELLRGDDGQYGNEQYIYSPSICSPLIFGLGGDVNDSRLDVAHRQAQPTVSTPPVRGHKPYKSRAYAGVRDNSPQKRVLSPMDCCSPEAKDYGRCEHGGRAVCCAVGVKDTYIWLLASEYTFVVQHDCTPES